MIAQRLWIGMCLLCVSLLGAGWCRAQPAAVALELAQSAGLEHWGRVASIEFTFNVKLPNRELARSWRWEPQAHRVTFKPGSPEAVTYTRDAITDELKNIDADFINDSYWLLFPFQLVWSDPVVTEAAKRENSPINGQWLRKITATWESGGYTPGDTYVLYVDDAGVIREWAFQRPGSADRPATWEQYIELAGLKIATDHRNADGSFRLFFTDIEVTTTAGESFAQ
jgi:hypothetical protein